MDKRERVEEAVREAHRFIKRAENLLACTSADQGMYEFPVESGATRRASLDLTRALAEMRKP